MRALRLHFLLLLMLASVSVAATDETVFISTGEYPPFTSEKLPQGGFVNAIISESFALQKIKVVFRFHPWQQAYDDVVSGKVHASSYWYQNEAREHEVTFSDPLLQETTFFFSLKIHENLKWQTLNDLSRYKIGAVEGYTYTPHFWQLAQKGSLNVHVVKTDEENFIKLLSGELDVVPMGYEAGVALLTQKLPRQSLTGVTIVEKPLVRHFGYLVFSKTHEANNRLRERFNLGLSELKRTGRYDALYEERFLINAPLHLRKFAPKTPIKP